MIIIALLLASLGVASLIRSAHAQEPTLENILDTLGFTQRTLVLTQTFGAGDYKITMYAEFAGYRDQNQLRWYWVGTSGFNLIFDGPDGVPVGQPMGYVPSPETTATKSFSSGSGKFGLSLLSPDSASPFFTETSRNLDGHQHAKVYQSTTNPNLYFIGFENMASSSGSDFDYNDMVVSLERTRTVGGEWAPITLQTLSPLNALQLFAPWIALALMAAATAIAGYLRLLRKHW